MDLLQCVINYNDAFNMIMAERRWSQDYLETLFIYVYIISSVVWDWASKMLFLNASFNSFFLKQTDNSES